jgi:hypothetical protein
MKQKIIGSSAKYKCNQYNNELTQKTKSENVDSKSMSVESKKILKLYAVPNMSCTSSRLYSQLHQDNNNNQAFYSQASWGRLEMKPHEQKKQVQNKSEK